MKNTENNSSYTFGDIKRQLADGIVFRNPLLVQLLGMCPSLAVTTSVTNALGMGLAATAVLICSNAIISLLRKFIPSQVRIASYIVIISAFVTAVELLIKAFLPELDKSLGVFIPLIVVNCVILARAESYASRHKVLPSAVDGLASGLGFTAALVLMGTIREVLGAGSFAGIKLFGEGFKPSLMFIMPAGAFITLGFLVAGAQKLTHVLGRKINAKSEYNVEAKEDRSVAALSDEENDTVIHTETAKPEQAAITTAKAEPTTVTTTKTEQTAFPDLNPGTASTSKSKPDTEVFPNLTPDTAAFPDLKPENAVAPDTNSVTDNGSIPEAKEDDKQ